MTATAAAPRSLDDAELARRIGARDEGAFETVMRAHNGMQAPRDFSGSSRDVPRSFWGGASRAAPIGDDYPPM